MKISINTKTPVLIINVTKPFRFVGWSFHQYIAETKRLPDRLNKAPRISPNKKVISVL